MSRRNLSRRIRARVHGERGFTILETVIAIMVVFASLTALAYTASIGFRYVGYGRDRIQATGIANRVMEDIRGLAYTKITNGISTTELSSDSRIRVCSGTYRFESCTRREDRLLDLRRGLRRRVAGAAHRHSCPVGQPRRDVPHLHHERRSHHDAVPRDGDHRVGQRRDQERPEQLGPAPEPLLVAERMRQPEHASVRRTLSALLLRPGRRTAGSPRRHRTAARLLGRFRLAPRSRFPASPRPPRRSRRRS